MRFFLVAALLSSGPVACGVACNFDAEPALVVSVVDRQMGLVLCTADVTATDGSYSVTLTTLGPLPDAPCVFSGAYERAGTYTVEARAEGRQSRVTGIEVTRNDCHVVPRKVAIEL
jgi:hypothetical protein